MVPGSGDAPSRWGRLSRRSPDRGDVALMDHAAPTDTGAGTVVLGEAEPRVNRVWTAILTLLVVVPMLAYLVWVLPRYSDELSFSLLFFIFAVAVVDLIPVPAWGGLQLSLSFPILLGVAMIYPAPIAAFVAVVGSFDPREFRREIPFFRAVWNRCQVGLSFLAGSAVFHHMASLESPWTRVVPAILLASVVAYTVNTVCVALYTSISRRISVGSVLAKMHGTAPYEFLLSYLGLGLFGAVIARFYVSEGLWSVAVLLAPLIFARQMYFRSRLLADRLAEQNRILADQARKLEELLEKEHHRVDELRELNRMKGEFVAVVSHELRTRSRARSATARTLGSPRSRTTPGFARNSWKVWSGRAIGSCGWWRICSPRLASRVGSFPSRSAGCSSRNSSPRWSRAWRWRATGSRWTSPPTSRCSIPIASSSGASCRTCSTMRSSTRRRARRATSGPGPRAIT